MNVKEDIKIKKKKVKILFPMDIFLYKNGEILILFTVVLVLSLAFYNFILEKNYKLYTYSFIFYLKNLKHKPTNKYDGW